MTRETDSGPGDRSTAPAATISRGAHSTRSGIEDVRSTLSVSERVDATAERMGLRLLPWQRELAINSIAGTPWFGLGYVGGRRPGRATVQDVVRGVRADGAWVDEATELCAATSERTDCDE